MWGLKHTELAHLIIRNVRMTRTAITFAHSILVFIVGSQQSIVDAIIEFSHILLAQEFRVVFDQQCIVNVGDGFGGFLR